MIHNDPEACLIDLVEGNRRFAGDRPENPNRHTEHRRALVPSQEPFATVVCCSDSRVDPAIIFDQGLGDLFVVRSAGAVADRFAEGTLEFAVEQLDTHLIVILGHSGCGAVNASLQEDMPKFALGGLVRHIRQSLPPGVRDLPTAVEATVLAQVEALSQQSPVIRKARRNGLLLIGAVYDQESGLVRFLEKS